MARAVVHVRSPIIRVTFAFQRADILDPRVWTEARFLALEYVCLLTNPTIKIASRMFLQSLEMADFMLDQRQHVDSRLTRLSGRTRI
jgi:hypothetical protein